MHEEIMKTKTIEELLLLVRNASGAIAYVAGEEIKRRLSAQQSVHADAATLCPECGEPFDFCAMGHYDVAKARRR